MSRRKPPLAVIRGIPFLLALSAVPSIAQDIKALYLQDNVVANVGVLVGFGPRVSGGDAENAAASWIANQLMTYGIGVTMQRFALANFEETGTPMFEMSVQNPPLTTAYRWNEDFSTMSYSGSGEVLAAIQAIDVNGSTSGCEPADFRRFAAGRIALIKRGTCSFRDKALNAQSKGAAGVIIFNDGISEDRLGVLKGTLGAIRPLVSIPVVGASFSVGDQLLLQEKQVKVHLKVAARTWDSESHNVIGTLPGTNPAAGIMYMGSHYDSVLGSPGANDNGSGVAAMLEAARVLASVGRRAKATLKFIAFGAEEPGLVGSHEYVQANMKEVSTRGLAMINLDMIGVGSTLFIGTLSSANTALRDYAGTKATSMGITWQFFTAGADSDHAYFAQAGVPSSFLVQAGGERYQHTPDDTLDKIQWATLEANGELATATMYDWAMNPPMLTKQAQRLEQVHVYKDKVLDAK